MCDYSLHAVAQRPARVGDKLVSAGFVGTTSRGFVAPSRPEVAVCLMPGTELAFDADVVVEAGGWFSSSRTVAGRVARFRKVNEHQQHAHHDALEFPGGEVVLLTELRKGQAATVLQLPAAATTEVAEATETAERPAGEAHEAPAPILSGFAH